MIEALKDYDKEKEPIARRYLSLVIRKAVQEGALYDISYVQLIVMFSIRDDAILMPLLVELLIMDKLFPNTPQINSFYRSHTIEAMLSCGRTDILEKCIRSGVFGSIDALGDIRFCSYTLLACNARFIPHNYTDFMKHLGVDDELIKDFHIFPTMLLPSILSRSFSIVLHPNLLVDAIKKGYIDAQHPIRDTKILDSHLDTFSSRLCDTPADDLKLIYNHLEEKAISTFHMLLEGPPAPEEYTNAADFLIFLEPDELAIMEKRYLCSDLYIRELENGNSISFNGSSFETLTELPTPSKQYYACEYVARGNSTSKDIKEFYEKHLRYSPLKWSISAIKYILERDTEALHRCDLDRRDLPVYTSMLEKCAESAEEILAKRNAPFEDEREFAKDMSNYLIEKVLFERMIMVHRDKIRSGKV